jgi:hypothetical protein
LPAAYCPAYTDYNTAVFVRQMLTDALYYKTYYYIHIRDEVIRIYALT